MTPAQLATLKVDIFSRWPQQIGNEEIADFYNSVAVPTVNVWKPEVTITELNSAIAWPDMVSLTIEKQLAFQTMIWSFKIDMTDAQVRNGIDTIFGSVSASKAGIVNVGKRPATYLESLFSTGGATKVSQVFGYKLLPSDVAEALNA